MGPVKIPKVAVETLEMVLGPEAAEEIRERSVELEETWETAGLEILAGPYEAAEDWEAAVVREVAAVHLTRTLGVMPVVDGVAGADVPTHLQGR